MYLDARERIFHEWPIALADLDKLTGWTAIEASGASSTQMVIFARETGLLSIIPHALYGHLISLPSPSLIRKGEHASSGSVVCLPVQDQLACLTAYHGICEAQAKTTYSWAFHPADLSPNCTGIQCSLVRQQYVLSQFTPVPRCRGMDIIDDMGFNFEEKLCPTCSHITLKMHEAGRAKFWEILPSVFDLPPWDELAKERDEMCVLTASCYQRFSTGVL